MARRTPEEILAQRDAWLARKTAREAGQDIPIQPPLRPGEVAETPAEPEVSAAPAEPVVAMAQQVAAQQVAAQVDEPQVTQPEPEVAQPSSEPEVARPVAAEDSATPIKPASPKKKRTPEEIKAQREAFMAARAAKAAGVVAEAPAPAKPAPTSIAAKPVPTPPAAKPTPRPKAAARPARKKAAPVPEPIDPNITRRELLNYAWLASVALFTVETVGVSLWFAFPNFLEGQFGGIFRFEQAGDILPEVNASPVPYNEGKFWLVNVDREVDGEPGKGVMALFKICTHLGCLYDWVDVTSRFECPCHGSKFELTGDYIAGPARRSLDRFVLQAVAPDGSVKESLDGRPLVVGDNDMLIIDTGAKILGSSDIIVA
jgi:cytochrome b6-f complex iron-sulfur subunit